MRELLFRGKRVDNGEWVYGSLVYYEHCPQYCIYVNEDIGGDGYNEPKYILKYYEVIPETVGQYTGLTDKNGTKIFEGDIVSTDLGRPYNIVAFRYGCFMYDFNVAGHDYYDIMIPIFKSEQTCSVYGEVIGNIYDNPELLRGDKE